MKLLLAFLLVVSVACSKKSLPSPPLILQPPAEPDTSMQVFVQEMFTRCNAKLSPARTELLKEQIARIVVQRIEDKQAQQAFVFMLCIESKFAQAAKSTVGAIGISQLMPQYAQGFATECGLGQIDAADIQDVETNLHLGGCFFNSLVKTTGNVYLAAAAYNAGLSSSSVKNLKALGSPVHETAAYVAKVALLQAELGDK